MPFAGHFEVYIGIYCQYNGRFVDIDSIRQTGLFVSGGKQNALYKKIWKLSNEGARILNDHVSTIITAKMEIRGWF